MLELGVLQPDIQPRATEHIEEMIALIKKLNRKKIHSVRFGKACII